MIYLLVYSCYDEHRIIHAYEDRADAEKALDIIKIAYPSNAHDWSIEEVELDKCRW